MSSGAIPEFIQEASVVFNVSPEILRRCKVDAPSDTESILTLDELLKEMILEVNPDHQYRGSQSLCEALGSIGFKENLHPSSMRDRLRALLWLAVKSRRWQRVRHNKYVLATEAYCKILTLANIETVCSAAPELNEWNRNDTLRSPDNRTINGDALSMTYGRIKSKLKYIQSLDESRIKLIYNIGTKSAERYPELTNTRHVRNLVVNGAANSCSDEEISNQVRHLKRLTCLSNTSKSNEAQFLKWASSVFEGEKMPDTRMKEGRYSQKKPRVAAGESGAIIEENAATRSGEGWSQLQQELRELYSSGMMAELEEAVSYHMNMSDGFGVSVAQKAVKASETKLELILRSEKGCQLEEQDGARVSESTSVMIMRDRLKKVHEEYIRDINNLQHRLAVTQHQRMQQMLSVRYSDTTLALAELRLKHKSLLQRIAAACEDANPYQIRYVRKKNHNNRVSSAPPGVSES